MSDASDAPTWNSTDKPLFNGSTGGASPKGWHKIESALRCMKEYQFTHVRGIYKPSNQTADALAVGAFFHAGRAAWFMNAHGTDAATWAKVQDAVTEEREKGRLPSSNDAEGRALLLVEAYIKHWSRRPLNKPVAVEYLLEGELVRGDPDTVRTARLDDVSHYVEAGGLAIGEAKTTSLSIGDCISEYSLHGQPLLQMALWKVSPQGEAMHGPIKGVVLDVSRKPYAKTAPDFARAFVPINHFAVGWFVQNLVQYLRVVAKVTYGSEVPRNISMCTRGVGRMRVVCSYREICLHGKEASGEYVTADGTSLRNHVRTDDEPCDPWD